jgi:hypothetical protein
LNENESFLTSKPSESNTNNEENKSIQIKKVINNENLEIINDKFNLKNIHDDRNEQKSYGDEMKYIN